MSVHEKVIDTHDALHQAVSEKRLSMDITVYSIDVSRTKSEAYALLRDIIGDEATVKEHVVDSSLWVEGIFDRSGKGKITASVFYRE